MARENAPVWTVYDKLRTVRLNVKYYGRRLASLERQNFWIELLLATTAPSSAIAGLWVWQTASGKEAWLGLGVLTAVVAVTKPLLGLTKRIKEFEGVLSGYRLLDFDLMQLKSRIEQKQTYNSALEADFDKISDRERALVKDTPEPRAKQNVTKACEAEVIRELPKDHFFVPQE